MYWSLNQQQLAKSNYQPKAVDVFYDQMEEDIHIAFKERKYEQARSLKDFKPVLFKINGNGVKELIRNYSRECQYPHIIPGCSYWKKPLNGRLLNMFLIK